MTEDTLTYLGLGTNLGDREENLVRALDLLGASIRIVDVSGIYETAPVGPPGQPWYLNAVCLGETRLDPHRLLKTVKSIEGEMGRRTSERWGSRVIDIDILLYSHLVLSTQDLFIPHPGIAEREFVLRPLAQIAPDLSHPSLEVSVSEMLSRVAGTVEMHLWRGDRWWPR